MRIPYTNPQFNCAKEACAICRKPRVIRMMGGDPYDPIQTSAFVSQSPCLRA